MTQQQEQPPISLDMDILRQKLGQCAVTEIMLLSQLKTLDAQLKRQAQELMTASVRQGADNPGHSVQPAADNPGQALHMGLPVIDADVLDSVPNGVT